MTPVDGLVVIDKPTGWTSHDVVGRMRRLAGTRKVGHAGTLDPMATGVLVLGLGRATRLLGYLSAPDTADDATIRLGQRTVTDDAEGELEGGASAADIGIEQVMAELETFVGDIQQVPSKVSAVKVAGERAYKRVRSGEAVELAPRAVTIARCDVVAHRRPTPDLLDVDVTVTCSSGTYIRAIARDLGQALGVGGHLTSLRRTRVGGFTLDQAHTLEECEVGLEVMPLGLAVANAFPTVVVDDETAVSVGFGRPIALPEQTPVGPTGVFDGHGTVLALMAPKDGLFRVVVGLTG